MTRRGKLAKSGVPRRKDMVGEPLGSQAESMKLLIFYKSEGKREREKDGEEGLGAAREMRWYRWASKKDEEKETTSSPVNKQQVSCTSW